MPYSETDLWLTGIASAGHLGDGFSEREYDRFAKEHDGLPRARTIHNNCGSFNEFKNEFGIETNKPNQDRPPYREIKANGYVHIRHEDSESPKRFYEHRLIATLLVDDLEELKGCHVHHDIPIPWLNYEDNLEVLSPEQHRKVHAEEQNPDADSTSRKGPAAAPADD